MDLRHSRLSVILCILCGPGRNKKGELFRLPKSWCLTDRELEIAFCSALDKFDAVCAMTERLANGKSQRRVVMAGWAMEPERLKQTPTLSFDLTHSVSKLGRDLMNVAGVDNERKLFLAVQVFCWRKTLHCFKCCTTELLPAILDPESTRQVKLTVADGDPQLQKALKAARDEGHLFSPHCKCRRCSFHLVTKPLREVVDCDKNLSGNDSLLVQRLFAELVCEAESQAEADTLWQALDEFLEVKNAGAHVLAEVDRLRGERHLFEHFRFLETRSQGTTATNASEVINSLQMRAKKGGLDIGDDQADAALSKLKEHRDNLDTEKRLQSHRLADSVDTSASGVLGHCSRRMSLDGHSNLLSQAHRLQHGQCAVEECTNSNSGEVQRDWSKPVFIVRRKARVPSKAFTVLEKRRKRNATQAKGRMGPKFTRSRPVFVCVDARGKMRLLCSCCLYLQEVVVCGHLLKVHHVCVHAHVCVSL